MDNKNKKLILTKTDNKYEVKVSPSGTILDILELLGNASLHVMKHCVEEAPEALKETIQKDLYDKYNCMASNILSAFDPEADLHPGLTERAILAMENKLNDEEYKEVMKMAKCKKKKKGSKGGVC